MVVHDELDVTCTVPQIYCTCSHGVRVVFVHMVNQHSGVALDQVAIAKNPNGGC